MNTEPNSNPIQELITEILETRYEGVTFSDAIVEAIEKKVAPAIRTQTEEITTDFIADFFVKSKPTRKPRTPRKKLSPPAEQSAPQSPAPAENAGRPTRTKSPMQPTPPVL